MTQNYSVSDLAVLLLEASNTEVDQFNEVYDLLEQEREKANTLAESNKDLLAKLDTSLTNNELVVNELNKLSDASDSIMSNGEKHLQYAEQCKREKAQALAKVTKVEMLLSQYKPLGTPKKIRDQIKAYKDKAADTVKSTNAHKQVVKDYRKEIDKLVAKVTDVQTELTVNTLTSMYSKDGEHLMVFPSKLTMEVNGVLDKQLTLLYMNNNGCGKLIGLDEDNEPVPCTTPRTGIKPKKATLALAGEMLRKFKSQNWLATLEDLDMESKQ